MENLVPREANDIDEGGYRQRLRLVTSLFSSLMIGIACLFLMSTTLSEENIFHDLTACTLETPK
jgi:hypothetical protein